ncbi:MAG TPA: methionine adenosyltransferase [Fimbriimonadaceae bacterium]|nr:methionine adenosyltransferase [Fimbriimonadaceae bacterium]
MRIYTSESVSVGHPDKLADQISDALLDAFFENEAPDLKGQTRVAVETLLTRGVAVVAGEVRTEGYVDVAKIVRETIASAGYTDTDFGFDGRTCGVLVAIQEQSADIAQGVDKNAAHKDVKRIGAGDQGMMFGYATRETDELMPLPLSISHALVRKSVEVRAEQSKSGKGPLLLPDAKSQVSVEYDNDGRPQRINTIVLSHQHVDTLNLDTVKAMVESEIIRPVLEHYTNYVQGDPILHINPTGRFVVGGPQGDTGVTGRKIIVDTYGGLAPHGGGAFSGKDPTKVDRSAAYMARYAAKNVVAAGLADRCVLQLAYAIGVAEPVAINVETFGTEKIDPKEIEKRIRDAYDLTPEGIIEHLGLWKVKYLPTAKNGHFGNPAFPWEDTSNSDRLK